MKLLKLALILVALPIVAGAVFGMLAFSIIGLILCPIVFLFAAAPVIIFIIVVVGVIQAIKRKRDRDAGRIPPQQPVQQQPVQHAQQQMNQKPQSESVDDIDTGLPK